MDKYEEMAGKLRDELRPPCECLNCQQWLVDRMADMLRLADSEREKETCEWTRNKVGWYSRSCEKGQSFPKPDDGVCTSCNRRIVEVKK